LGSSRTGLETILLKTSQLRQISELLEERRFLLCLSDGQRIFIIILLNYQTLNYTTSVRAVDHLSCSAMDGLVFDGNGI
jgi:hypothetical protein